MPSGASFYLFICYICLKKLPGNDIFAAFPDSPLVFMDYFLINTSISSIFVSNCSWWKTMLFSKVPTVQSLLVFLNLKSSFPYVIINLYSFYLQFLLHYQYNFVYIPLLWQLFFPLNPNVQISSFEEDSLAPMKPHLLSENLLH